MEFSFQDGGLNGWFSLEGCLWYVSNPLLKQLSGTRPKMECVDCVPMRFEQSSIFCRGAMLPLNSNLLEGWTTAAFVVC